MRIFLTLQEPTKGMLKECEKTNLYLFPNWKHEFLQIQILTIQQLLEGKRLKVPATISANQESLLTQRVSITSQEQTLFTQFR
jgi:hypothetical protein